MKFLMCALYIAVLGILAHFIGEALPRARFHPDVFPFRSFSWEKDGRIYRKIGVQKWKDHVPDVSRHAKGMVEKKLGGEASSEKVRTLVLETCVAEAVHWCLILLAPGICIIWPSPMGTLFFAADVLLLNLPFIVIQRYNRPKLERLYSKLLTKKERDTYEGADPVL